MSSSLYRLIVAVVLLAAGVAHAEETLTMQQMAEELAALRNEVAQLRGEKSRRWLDERQAEQVKALIREVLADAETRSSLLQDNLTAGHDGKFFIAAPDGSFRLNVGGNIQLRYVVNSREDPGTDEDGLETGFTLRRVEVFFSGHVADPRIGYFVQFATSRDTDAVDLQDLILSYQLDEHWTLWGGRDKAPVMREEVISSKLQLAVDRSLVNYLFSPEYVEGVALGYTNQALRFSVMFNDGANSGSVGGAGNDFHNDMADYAISARGEWKLAGDWKQTSDFAAWSGEPTSSVIGGAIHYEVGETGDAGASEAADETLIWTVDASLECEGLSLYGAAVGRHVDYDPMIGMDRDDYGFMGQLGYMVVPDKLEPFARFEWIMADDDAGAEDELRLATVGVNYYFRGHNTKLTLDVIYAFDPIVESNTLGKGLTGFGLLTDAAGEDDQVAARAQFQLRY